MKERFIELIAVGAGSCVGGMLRYFVSRVLHAYWAIQFPLGTFVVNVAGCLILGLLCGLFNRGYELSAGWRLFLTVGFCGGFTTFSTFINENVVLSQAGHVVSMIVYAGISFVAGMACLYLGMLLARLF